jgi:mannitol/fructose-specific phosphotransferase system IIA component (Ntr-type)
MINFSNVLDTGRAAVGIRAADKTGALKAAIRMLCASDEKLDETALLSAIIAREGLSSTGVGEGVAIPHALLDGIERTSMAVVRLDRPVAFGAADEVPVDLIFMIAGPKKGTSGHLQLLSKLARAVHDPVFRQAAREAPDGPALARLLLERN